MRRWLWDHHNWIFAVCLMIGIAARWSNYGINHPDLLFADYFRMAGEILDGKPMELARAPLYPSILAAVEAPGRGQPGRNAVIAQISLSGLSVAATYALASSLSSPIAGVVSAGLLAFNYAHKESTYSLGLECVFSFLVLNAALQLLLWARNPTTPRALMAAAALGFCLACRSTLVLLPAFLILGAWIIFRLENTIWLAAAYVFVIPWTLHNFICYRAFVPFEGGGSGIVSAYLASRGEIEWGNRTVPEVQDAARTETPELRGKDFETLIQGMQRLTVSHIMTHPISYAVSCFRRLGVWFGYEAFLHVLLAVAVILGRRNPAVIVLSSIPLYMAAAHMPLAQVHRFLVPEVPVLCALAGFAVDRTSMKVSSVRKDPLLTTVAKSTFATACALYLITLIVLGKEIFRFIQSASTL